MIGSSEAGRSTEKNGFAPAVLVGSMMMKLTLQIQCYIYKLTIILTIFLLHYELQIFFEKPKRRNF